MSRRVIWISGFVLVALALLAPTAPADASCWECHVHYVGGGDLGLWDWVVWCGPGQDGQLWDCWVDENGNCYPYGFCWDYIDV